MKKTFLLAAVLIWSATLFAQDYNITFKVNMNEVAEPFTTPEVNGSFNGWCGGCAPMTDDNGDGIWKTTITLPAGTYEYKFAYDTWTGQESLTPGSSCTITTGEFTNRKLTVTQDEILDVVCWGACLDCGEVAPTRNITFKVDMTPVLGSFTTPEVNGTFNGWCGGCNPMTDANGDNVWEVTIAIPDGNYEYKFAYDSWAGQESLTPGSSCTVSNGGFTNRTLNVTQNQSLPKVCWGSCTSDCPIALEQMDLPVTFDEAGVEYGLIGFGGAENSVITEDPTLPGNMVARVVKSGTAELWAGTTVTGPAALGFATPIAFSETETKLYARVWSPDAGIPVLLKVEEHANGAHSVETFANTTASGAWETLEFDFANEAPGTAALNLSYTYDKASIFFNFGTTGAQAGEKTYYFDDLAYSIICVATPVTVAAGGPTTYCKPGSVMLAQSSVGTFSSYQWQLDGVNINNATSSTYEAKSTGSHTLIATNACGSASTSNAIDVTANKKPKADVTPAGPVSICAGGSVELSVVAGNKQTYQWKKNGNNNIPGATNNTLLVTTAGEYKCKVTKTTTGCTNTSKPVVVTVDCKVGTPSITATAFPNPTSDYFMLNTSGLSLQDGLIKIYDLAGKLLETYQVESDATEIGTQLLSGVYFAKIESSGNVLQVIKLVKN